MTDTERRTKIEPPHRSSRSACDSGETALHHAFREYEIGWTEVTETTTANITRSGPSGIVIT